jgi:hypothetical protein
MFRNSTQQKAYNNVVKLFESESVEFINYRLAQNVHYLDFRHTNKIQITSICRHYMFIFYPLSKFSHGIMLSTITLSTIGSTRLMIYIDNKLLRFVWMSFNTGKTPTDPFILNKFKEYGAFAQCS